MNLCLEPFGKLLLQPENAANPVQESRWAGAGMLAHSRWPQAEDAGEAGEFCFSCSPWEGSPGESRGHCSIPKAHLTEKCISGGGQKQVLRDVKEQGRQQHSHQAPRGCPHLSCGTHRAGVLLPKSHQSSSGKDQTQVKVIHLMASEGLQAVWWWVTSVITVARERPKNSLKKWIHLDKRIKTDPLAFSPKHVPSVA